MSVLVFGKTDQVAIDLQHQSEDVIALGPGNESPV